MKKLKLLLSLGILFFALYSCNEQLDIQGIESIDSKKELQKPFTKMLDDSEINYCGEPVECTLIAGQNIDAGKVTVINDGVNLYVKVYSKAGFQDVEENIKMWIGTEPPSKRPQAGHFPYKVTESGDTYTFQIELSSIDAWGGECGENTQPIYIILHADVITESGSRETAFGGCIEGAGKAWWYYMEYNVQCCEEDDMSINAFGRKSNYNRDCLTLNIDINSYGGWSSWMTYQYLLDHMQNGWVIRLELYTDVGIDNCDISNTIERLGALEITGAVNDGGINGIKTRYIMYPYSGLKISETSLYIGNGDILFENDGTTFKDNLDINMDNFSIVSYSEVKTVTDWVFTPWSGDPDSLVYVIPHAKLVE